MFFKIFGYTWLYNMQCYTNILLYYIHTVPQSTFLSIQDLWNVTNSALFYSWVVNYVLLSRIYSMYSWETQSTHFVLMLVIPLCLSNICKISVTTHGKESSNSAHANAMNGMSPPAIKHTSSLHVKCRIFSSDLTISGFSQDFHKSPQYKILRKYIQWQQCWYIWADRQTWRR